MGIARPPFEMVPFGTGRDGNVRLPGSHRQIGHQKGYRAYQGLSNQAATIRREFGERRQDHSPLTVIPAKGLPAQSRSS